MEKDKLEGLYAHFRIQKYGFYICFALTVVSAAIMWRLVEDADVRNILLYGQTAMLFFIGSVFSSTFRAMGRAIAREEEKRAKKERLSRLGGKEGS